MVEKRCRLMSTYGWSEQYVKWGITGARGWVFFTWAMEAQASLFGSGLRRTSDGYRAQEIKKQLEKIKHGKK